MAINQLKTGTSHVLCERCKIAHLLAWLSLIGLRQHSAVFLTMSSVGSTLNLFKASPTLARVDYKHNNKLAPVIRKSWFWILCNLGVSELKIIWSWGIMDHLLRQRGSVVRVWMQKTRVRTPEWTTEWLCPLYSNPTLIATATTIGSAEIWIFVQPSFPPKPTLLSILPG